MSYSANFFYLSLRGSIATAAIRRNEVRTICRVLFQGDRHACARDDTFLSPIGALRHFPSAGTPPFRQAAPATFPVSSGKFTPKEEAKQVCLPVKGRQMQVELIGSTLRWLATSDCVSTRHSAAIYALFCKFSLDVFVYTFVRLCNKSSKISALWLQASLTARF